MTSTTDSPPALHVVPIRYNGHEPVQPSSDPVDAYLVSDGLSAFGATTVSEPAFPEAQRATEPTDNLGLLGGEIAQAVAEGRRAGKPVLVIGGNCASVPGVIGGLQEAHGAAARIGLV